MFSETEEAGRPAKHHQRYGAHSALQSVAIKVGSLSGGRRAEVCGSGSRHALQAAAGIHCRHQDVAICGASHACAPLIRK